MTIGELTLVTESREQSGKRIRSKWQCICSCGEQVSVWGSNLKSYKCHHNKPVEKPNRRIDLSGQRFGMLIAIEHAPVRITKGGHVVTRWKCVCDCGNIKIADTCELRKGTVKSCGCYTSKFLIDKRSLVGQKFGKLTVLEQDESKTYVTASNTVSILARYKCKCECGTVSTIFAAALRNGQISCGCVNSKGEEEIAMYLSNKDIYFEKQKTFEDCLSPRGYVLPFDFYVRISEDISFLIEYQGEQHYKEFSNHFGEYEREVTDDIKRNYCKQNGIVLHEIRYDEDVTERLDSIIANAVPSAA